MKTRKVFPGAIIDADSDVRNVQPNHVRYALNCLLNDTNGESTGTIENRKGNLLVSTQLPIGRNKVIGTCADIDKNAILYMVFNSQNMHCIMRYNIESNTIDRIVYSNPYLNFQEDHLITHVNVIGDLLYWTDGYFNKFTYDPQAGEFQDIGFNGPRKINMVKAYNFTNNINVPAAQKYTQINERVLDRIKYPPYKQPVAEYGSDPNKHFNYLIGNLFQFACAYAYDDKEVSVLGPISDVPIPLNQEYVTGTYNLLQPTQNNVINLTFNTGDQTVSQIKLFVRRLNDGDWYLFDTVDKFDSDGVQVILNDIDYQFSYSVGKGFYNNEVLISQDQVNLARPFDFIGQIVDSQSLISDGRMIDAGITENYNNVDIAVKLQSSFVDVDFLGTNTTVIPFITQPFAGSPLSSPLTGVRVRFQFPATGYTGALYSVFISVATTSNPTNPTVYSFNYIQKPTDVYPNDVMTSLQTVIQNSIGSMNGVTIDIATRYLYIGLAYLYFEEPIDPEAEDWDFEPMVVVANMSIIGDVPVLNSFKEGFDHYFALGYSDRGGRNSALNKSEESNIYIPFITENQGYQGISTSVKKANLIDWEVSHRPPEWATHYQWYYARQTPKFLQFYYTDANPLSDGIHIKINEKIVLLHDTRKKSRIEAYTFTEGDRVRFIATGQFAVPSSWWYFPTFIDTEIVGFDIATGEIIIEDIGWTSSRIQIPSGWDYNIIEIYTPRKINDISLYKAIGPKMDIYLPHTEQRAHIGSDGGIQTFSTNFVNLMLKRIDITITAPNTYQFKFVIDYPFNSLLPQNYFNSGDTITIMGLTDPQSTFLNGQHTIDFTTTLISTNEMQIIVNTTQVYPALTQADYYDFPPFTGGYIPIGLYPVPAKGTFNQGDVYVKGRYAVEPPLIPVESDRLSDYYPSNAISIGHVSAVVPDIKRQKYSTIRHSGQYLEDTRVNNLSKVEVLDKDNVSNEYGDITAIRELGMTLKVLQPMKVTSFGIGYQSLSTADGGDIPVLSSTKILSNRRPSNLNYGCSNPESVLVSERYMYFYDINSGKFIRDDANGMDAISDRGVKTWFRKKKEQLLQASKYYVLTSRKEAEIIVTFISYYTPPQSRESEITVATIVYNENINFWTTFLSYHKTVLGEIHPPDYYGNLGNTMLSFMDGQVYVEGANPLYNNFFGEQYAMEVDVIDNADFEKMKIYQAIALSTNSNVGDFWDAPEVRTPASAKLPLGGLTLIRPGRFREKEGALYADIPRNMLTPMAGTDNFKMLNGDMMRGEVCVYKLRNISTEAVQLYSVIFRNIPSEISK